MRSIISRHKRLVYALVALVLLLAGLVIRHNLIEGVSTQEPWKRWSADGTPYGYVAAFYPDNEGITEDSVKGYRGSLDNSLKEASIEVKDSSRGYIDAYSAYGKAEIYGDRNNAKTMVNVTAAGGEYFFIHPMRLLSGNYLSDDDLMKDRVVIDENTAWFLYGSSDIAGKSLTIGDKRFYIAGVVEVPDSADAQKTYGVRNRIYMSYEAYTGINQESSITCYEIIYPDLITNFAYNTLRDALGLSSETSEVTHDILIDESSVSVINMNTRFRTGEIWDVICSYGERSSHTDGIIYPFWENECRRIEDMLAIELIFRVVCILIIMILLLPYLILIFKFGKHRLKLTSEYIISRTRC